MRSMIVTAYGRQVVVGNANCKESPFPSPLPLKATCMTYTEGRKTHVYVAYKGLALTMCL